MATKAIRATIELDAKQQAILRQQLDTGRYQNANEVISDALRLVSERDAMFDEWLRGEVTAVMADKRRPAPMDNVFSRIEARHSRRVKADKRGSK
jgi:antitoxin ParD1/3/4